MTTERDVQPPCPLEEVLATHELAARFDGRPRYPDDAELLLDMTRGIAADPQAALQRLVEMVLRVTRADGAGVSLVEQQGDSEVFRWVATAGMVRPLLGHTMPRHASPCGEVLARDTLLLMRDPHRHYPAVQALGAPLDEVLLAPVRRESTTVGTLWVLSVTGRRFDAEDARVMQTLCTLASQAGDLFDRLSYGNPSYLEQ